MNVLFCHCECVFVAFASCWMHCECVRMSAWKQDWELSKFVTNGPGLRVHPLVPPNLEGRLESCLASQGMTLKSTLVRSPLHVQCVTITYHIADIRVRASSGPSLRGEDGFLVCALPQSSVALRGTTMSRQISTIEATPPMLAWSCSSQPLWRRRATCGATSTWDLHC